MKVFLSIEELNVLREALLHEKSQFDLNSVVNKGPHPFLSIDENQADELRDICGDFIAVIGFDEEYKPNEKGLLLELLIDKLLVR